ncbi:PIG-L family deacetylase [Cellulomonas persica]|uniref:1D-myo-inositol 2-acetamido-2-deoxy-alpha-D-glucopyranoside deacetylase n=1 Tax=Cellulomonas persica TaxID=76861 RepID=A0A510UY45_9CELL|nr:PIG-L family deacetylase [Cellulomonas persica]GEK18010.1 1D-myo-inositol 2-acetamido-2-deoxy-alpha-D-glucopyranoside deacetylase [Cellulomonas persica]
MSASSPAASGGLLAVHAHPDDETLATGSLLATWAAAGRPVTLVTCTRGERGEVIGEALAGLEGDGPALAAHREAELAAATAALGVVDRVFLDALLGWSGGRLEDSGMAWADEGRRAVAAPDAVAAGTAFSVRPLDEVAAPLAALILDRRPDVVVTYEPGGGYGHPDHVRAHEVAHRAVELAAQADEPYEVPVVLWAAQGLSRARAARRALRSSAADGRVGQLTAPADDDVFASVVVPDDDIALEVDVLPVRDAVLAALHAHVTQVQHAEPVDEPVGGERALVGRYALSLGLAEPLLPVEQYRDASSRPGRARGRHARTLADRDWPAGVRPVA